MARRYRIGDKVIYTRDKYTPRPSPRAKNVVAERNGELYQYQVEKYWIVSDVRADSLVLKTRRGKEHVVACDDPRLRKAGLVERLLKATLFPTTNLGDLKLSEPSA